MPRKKAELQVDDPDGCEACYNGHQEGCDWARPAYDLGDLVCRGPCSGCCPNGCTGRGGSEQQAAVIDRLKHMSGRN